MGENRPGAVVVDHLPSQYLDQGYINAALSGCGLTPVFTPACKSTRDDGCGMSDETRDHIFEPFFTTKFTGRGLGLSAALGIVNAHKGAIRVYSTPGHGTTFKVWLPALAGLKPEEQRQAAPAKPAVLVVDDEEMVRKVAKASLEKRGYTVLVASNGREGVDLFSNVPAIALVILDLTMPVMNGDEALRRMRQARPGVPVIVSSGYSEAETMKRFRGEPGLTFIQKPYTGAVLSGKSRGRPASRCSGGVAGAPSPNPYSLISIFGPSCAPLPRARRPCSAPVPETARPASSAARPACPYRRRRAPAGRAAVRPGSAPASPPRCGGRRRG